MGQWTTLPFLSLFLDMVRGYLFEPAMLDGQPVPVGYILVLRTEVF